MREPPPRPAMTLVELLIFTALLGLVAALIIPVLVSSNVSRVRQESIASVEQSGIQLIQSLTNYIHRSERILDPPLLQTGSILALQVTPESNNPTIIVLQSGALMLVRGDTLEALSSTGTNVTNFIVANTSARADRPSVHLSFIMSMIIPLAQPIVHTRLFETTVSLYPDTETQGDDCGCTPPTCSGGVYQWQVCNQNSSCASATTSITCS